MDAPGNILKRELASGRTLFGVWLGLGDALPAEIAGRAGYDWCLIDAEHGPNDLPRILAQLQALAATPAHPVVRLPAGEPWMIKQVLDLGAQTIMIPMVETAAQARDLVRATRYPPQGIRGVGAALGRASHWNGMTNYTATANDEIALIAQLESRGALENLEEIAAVEGVDALFIGPADLAADMGCSGDDPDLHRIVAEALGRIRGTGKAAGIIAFDPAATCNHAAAGANFIGIGADSILLARALREGLERCRAAVGEADPA